MTTAQTSTTVIGLFENVHEAEDAVRKLQDGGYSREDTSVVAGQTKHRAQQSAEFPDLLAGSPGRDSKLDRAADAAADAGIGAALGGLGGLLVGLAALAIPGLGPIVAAGPIVATLSGMGIGAAAGGIIGALTEAGVPKEEAKAYAEGIRRGQVLVTVKVHDQARAERAREILDSSGAMDVEDRPSGASSSGPIGHHPGAEPLSADELRRDVEHCGPGQGGNAWRKLTVREKEGADPALSATTWPHKDARDEGESLRKAEAENAALSSPSQTDLARDDRDTQNSNRQWGASIENNLRVTDPPSPVQNRGSSALKKARCALPAAPGFTRRIDNAVGR